MSLLLIHPLSISGDGLIKATSEVVTRFYLGVRGHTSFLSSIMKHAGHSLEDIALSKSGTHRKRFQNIKSKGEEIRNSYKNVLIGKNLLLHFDSKLCNEWDLKNNITVKMGRIAVSLTAPENDNSSDILQGVFQANSSKGKDQAKQIKKVHKDFEIENNIFAVCPDTTASNAGAYNGGVELVSRYVVGKHIMWLLCR